MKMNTLVKVVPVLATPIVLLAMTAYSLRAQPTPSKPQGKPNSPPSISQGVLLRQRGLRTPDNSSQHVELRFLRYGYDCYVSARRDKDGVLHDVVMRSYFPYSIRNPKTPRLSPGVFPEICLAKSMSPDPTVPNQWTLEGAMYHISKTDGTQLQEKPTNEQQPKTIKLLPVKG